MLYAFSDSRFWTIVYRDFSYGFTKITTFVFKEMARMGITPPDFENKTEAEIEAEIEDYKEKMKFTQ